MEITPDDSLDLRGKQCPFTIIEIGKALKSLGAGKVLEIVADGDSAADDIRAWCAGTGIELVAIETDECTRVYLKRP